MATLRTCSAPTNRGTRKTVRSSAAARTACNSCTTARAGGSPRRRGIRPCDQPRAALVREVGPRPFRDHEKAVAEADEEENVDREPGDPGEEAAQFQESEIGDGGGAADGG